ncbi:MAG: glycosyltransferase family 1 protein [Chloroflexi bacterium]|nr:glycosyltransferase family 1 protein [Chloroflexota bacterium]
MRILVLSNLYPPHDLGGYEQRCAEVVQELIARSHTVRVLTSRFGLQYRPYPDGVLRRLYLESDIYRYSPFRFFTTRPWEERLNLKLLRQLVGEFNPDLIYIWGMWNLPRSLAWSSEKLKPGRVVYAFEGDWPYLPSSHQLYWQLPARRPAARFVRSMLRVIALSILRWEGHPHPLRLNHAHFISDWLKAEFARHGLPMPDAPVINGGIHAGLFAQAAAGRCFEDHRLKLLYAGSLVYDKGVHTAIKAVSQVIQAGGQVTLTIVGQGQPHYEKKLRSQVTQAGLDPIISFVPWKSREEMPALLARYDALLFPTHHETFGRIAAEAMASGMIVLSTRIGGTADFIFPERTGLAFAPEDAHTLALHIQRLLDNPDLCRHLSQSGQVWALENLHIDRMVDKIEAFLYEVSGSAC